jgi:hypothetical protein
MDLPFKSFALTMVYGAAGLVSIFALFMLILSPPIYVLFVVATGTLTILLVGARLIHRRDSDSPDTVLRRTALFGVLFAIVGFGIVVAIGVQYLELHVRPATLLLWLAPVTIFWATEGEPPWIFLVAIIAPLNAALYSGIAIAITSIVHQSVAKSRIRTNS